MVTGLGQARGRGVVRIETRKQAGWKSNSSLARAKGEGGGRLF